MKKNFLSLLPALLIAGLTVANIASAGVVPYPNTETQMTGFRPSTPLASQGAFSVASTPGTAISGYGSGACIPISLNAKNTSNKTGDMRVTFTYPYENGTQIGVDNLEITSVLVSGDPSSVVTNLNQFSFGGMGLNALTSVTLDNGAQPTASVEGPYRGDNTGKSPIKNQAETRHYNVQINSVPAGRTAYITACARMSQNTNVIVDPYAVVTTLLGGQNGGSVYIAKAPSTPPSTTTLKVTKVVVNDNGGTDIVSDFPLLVNGSSVISGETNEYAPGTYTVTEITDSRYASTFSGDCDADGIVTLNSGDQKECVLTNNDNPTYLTVNVQVTNDDGGTQTAADFQMLVDGTSVTAGTAMETTPGFHDVTVSDSRGYMMTFSDACNASGVATVLANAGNTCTVTFDDPALAETTLTILTNVVNNNSGTLTEADFPVTLDTASVPTGIPLSVAAQTHVVGSVRNGFYVTTFGGDCNPDGTIAIAQDEHKTCIVIHDDAAPGLTVVTHVINDNGGTAVASDFITILQAVGSPTQSLNGSETGVLIENSVGFYGVGQAFLPSGGYNVTFEGDCFGVINPGDMKVCTIIDDDIAPQLTIVTSVVNDNGGTAVASDFTTHVTATNPSSQDFQGDAGGVTITINAGAYSVDELPVSLSYNKILDTGCSGTIAVGQAVTCTITNDDF
jgi:hypothetical protein